MATLTSPRTFNIGRTQLQCSHKELCAYADNKSFSRMATLPVEVASTPSVALLTTKPSILLLQNQYPHDYTSLCDNGLNTFRLHPNHAFDFIPGQLWPYPDALTDMDVYRKEGLQRCHCPPHNIGQFHDRPLASSHELACPTIIPSPPAPTRIPHHGS